MLDRGDDSALAAHRPPTGTQRDANRMQRSTATTTTSSSAPARPAACWPTGCRADPRNRVLLLEAGGSDHYHWVHIPVGYLYCIGNPRTDWMMKTAAGARPQRPRARLSARQGAGRLLVDQRHDLHARPGGRLRPLAAARQCRLGLGRRAALFPQVRGPPCAARPTLHGAGGEWRVERQRLPWPILDAVPRGGRGIRHPARATISTTATTRAPAIFEVNQQRRHALEHGEGLPAPGAEAAATCASDRRRDRAPDVRRQARRPACAIALDGTACEAQRRRARCSSRPARSTRRSSSSSPASAGPTCCATRHRRRATTCPASARTCRIICRSAPSSRSTGATTLNQRYHSLLGKAAHRAANMRCAAAGRCRWRRASSASSPESDPRVATPDLEYHVQPLVDRPARRPAAPLPGHHRLGLQSAARKPRHACTCATPRSGDAARRSGRTTSPRERDRRRRGRRRSAGARSS